MEDSLQGSVAVSFRAVYCSLGTLEVESERQVGSKGLSPAIWGGTVGLSGRLNGVPTLGISLVIKIFGRLGKSVPAR